MVYGTQKRGFYHRRYDNPGFKADGKCTDKIIDISSIPYREGKTTRIRMDIYAVSQDKCMLTIKDLGFGEIFRTSGRVITEEIDLSEACL